MVQVGISRYGTEEEEEEEDACQRKTANNC
jgi:hypothetical protein